jgi:hypothetical protein
MPSALIQSTMPPPEPQVDDQADVAGDGSGQSGASSAAGSRSRNRARRKAAVSEKSAAHKLTLPDSVFQRLELQAIKKGSNVSTIAAEILDRNLPRHRIVTDE